MLLGSILAFALLACLAPLSAFSVVVLTDGPQYTVSLASTNLCITSPEFLQSSYFISTCSSDANQLFVLTTNGLQDTYGYYLNAYGGGIGDPVVAYTKDSGEGPYNINYLSANQTVQLAPYTTPTMCLEATTATANSQLVSATCALVATQQWVFTQLVVTRRNLRDATHVQPHGAHDGLYWFRNNNIHPILPWYIRNFSCF